MLFEVCVDGECVPDPCGGIECAPGLVCSEGLCGEDACAEVECEARCVEGACAPDPCADAHCPPGQACHVVQDSAQCRFGEEDEPPAESQSEGADAGVSLNDEAPVFVDAGGGRSEADPIVATPSAGCECDQRGDAPTLPLLLLLSLALVPARPRRRPRRRPSPPSDTPPGCR